MRKVINYLQLYPHSAVLLSSHLTPRCTSMISPCAVCYWVWLLESDFLLVRLPLNAGCSWSRRGFCAAETRFFCRPTSEKVNCYLYPCYSCKRCVCTRSVIESLLDSIPTRFSAEPRTESALGSAIRGALAALVCIYIIWPLFSYLKKRRQEAVDTLSFSKQQYPRLGLERFHWVPFQNKITSRQTRKLVYIYRDLRYGQQSANNVQRKVLVSVCFWRQTSSWMSEASELYRP